MDNIYNLDTFIYFGSQGAPLENPIQLTALGITHIINCSLLEYQSKLIQFNYPLDDVDDLSFTEYMDEIVQKIEDLVTAQTKIYVHSKDECSVAYSILIYYLMTYKSMKYNDAFDCLEAAKPNIEIAPMFEDLLRLIES